jgi:hypothetical protein
LKNQRVRDDSRRGKTFVFSLPRSDRNHGLALRAILALEYEFVILNELLIGV